MKTIYKIVTGLSRFRQEWSQSGDFVTLRVYAPRSPPSELDQAMKLSCPHLPSALPPMS